MENDIVDTMRVLSNKFNFALTMHIELSVGETRS